MHQYSVYQAAHKIWEIWIA